MSAPLIAKHYMPLIPCARCIRNLFYPDAVVGHGDGWIGFVHPGPCDPADIAEKARRDARIVRWPH